ncbi:ATP-binding protein [Polynucleobacter rarus]|jgi:anti-sigma regulatory factor (Ser/Thr protein kinase)|uniref:ATP-binding protein n=1 Tax=Polynucleobacter rarus TaxID=556055 RepID=UPI000D3E7759|nr:ATP-binding protein [Polynucleobacter rarus]
MISQITVQGKLEKLLNINQWLDNLADQGDLSKSSLFAMKLCCEETFMNIVMHSYQPENLVVQEEDKVVNLAVKKSTEDIILSIEDNGFPFNPLEKEEKIIPTDLKDVQIGGLGISLMKKFSKSIHYEPKNTGNRLIFQFQQ